MNAQSFAKSVSDAQQDIVDSISSKVKGGMGDQKVIDDILANLILNFSNEQYVEANIFSDI